MFLMFRFFPLNLDWNLKNQEEKISKEALKLNEETTIGFFYKCVQILNKIHRSQESHQK